MNLDLDGNAIYNVFSGESHTFFFTMKNELMGFGDNQFGQLSGEFVAENQQSHDQKIGKGKDQSVANQQDVDTEKMTGSDIQQSKPAWKYFDLKSILKPQIFKFNERIEVSKVICGSGFTFCIDNFQKVFSWGLNNQGQLGQGHKKNIQSPTLVVTLSSSKPATKESLLKTDTRDPKQDFVSPQQSELTTLNKLVQKFALKRGEVVTDLACGGAHTIAITSKNRIMTCGFGLSGALGHRAPQPAETSFREVEAISTWLGRKYASRATELDLQIKAGVSHSCCLVVNSLFVWGTFGNTDLGQFSWTPVELNIKFDISDFDCGDLLTVFLSTIGEVYTIGDWKNGVLGGSRDKTEKMFTTLQKELNGKTLQSSKSQSVFNRKRSQSRRRRGRNPRSAQKELLTPWQVGLSCKVNQIAVGSRHIYALNQNAGRIFTWGNNKYGQCSPYLKKQIIWKPKEIDFLDHCGSFVILCKGNDSFLISRKLIQSTFERHEMTAEDKQEEILNELEHVSLQLGKEKKKHLAHKKQLKTLRVKLADMNKRIEQMRMLIKQENFVGESAVSYEPMENDYKYEINNIIKCFKTQLSADRTLKPVCEIPFEELQLERQISEGGFGLIYKAHWRNTLVAVKVMKKELMKRELIKDFLSKVFYE